MLKLERKSSLSKNKILIITSIIINFILIGCCLFAYHKYNNLKLSHRSVNQTIYKIKESNFQQVGYNSTDKIVFLGDSLTDYCEWNELLNNPQIINRGIGADTTHGILQRINTITKLQPKKIFIMIGINDLLSKHDMNTIISNYSKIIDTVKKDSPKTSIYIQSCLPVNDSILKSNNFNDNVMKLNNELQSISKKYNVTFIDLYKSFLDKNNQLNSELTSDGLHLNGKGYEIWKNEIVTFINQ